MVLLRLLAGTLALLSALVPALDPHVAEAYLVDTASHPPPTSGPYAYFATYGTFSPSLSGFPAVGGTFVDPVFGSTIRRLTNELDQYSFSENYAKNGFINADGTLMHHRAPTGHNIIDTTTGQVVRANVPFNFDSSFAPDDPDVFYWFTFGSPTLNKYSVSTGTSSVVKTFTAALSQVGGSVDWIDSSGRYMVLMLGGAIRVYDVKSDILYAGSIPASNAASGGWVGISPDGNYVITATDPPAFRSFRIDHAEKSVSTAGVLFWTLCGDHADVVSGSDGKTYLVAFECHSEAAIYAVDVTIPQTAADPAKQRADNRRIIKLASWTDTVGHFSGVSTGPMKDWFFFTIESGDDTFTSPVTSAWRPYMQELMMANALTGEVRRLAHHRSRSVTTNYFYTPRPSASWDGSLVTWVSNFGHSAEGYADLYAIDVSETVETEPPPPPPPPPLAVVFTNPASGATVSGTITVSMSASGGSGTGYTYTVKAGTTTIYTGTNASFSWNTTTTPNGSVTLTATVTDAALAIDTDSRTVTVSNKTKKPPPRPR